MRKIVLAIAFLLATVSVSAQFYASLSGGPTFKVGEKKLSPTGNMGSYGEGFQGQIRGGYFFNEKFGADLAIGYLHGNSQEIINTKGTFLNAKARAYGAALSGIYNVTKNLYVRAGLLTKLGGKTVMDGYISRELPAKALNPAAPAAATVPLIVDFTRNNRGKFPIGFLGSLGFKFDLGSNFGFFTEIEYMGINVNAKTSELGEYSIKLAGKDISKYPAAVGNYLKQSLGTILADEISYVDNPSKGKPEAKSFKVPYSSIGFNFGITYTFKK